ncbi:MAG: methyl-accepting chemotaxis sensory transducer [Bacilli bacterium]|nr:methyl-accepting chemotaxis sensory transducer [Bacilli bacterium]
MKTRVIDLSLKGKLILSFVGMLLLFLSAAYFNLHQVNGIKSQMDNQNSKVDLKLMALDLKVLTQELKDISSGLMISHDLSYVAQYNEKKVEFQKKMKEMQDSSTTPEQNQWRSLLILSTVDFLDTFDRAVNLMTDKSYSALDIQKNTESLYTQSQQQRDAIFKLVDNFYVVYSKDAQFAVTTSYGMLDHTVSFMIIATVAVLLSGIFIAYFLIRSFTRPINRLQKAVALISTGDLRHKINSISKDELGLLSHNFDLMIDQVRDMLRNTQQIASSLSEHSSSFHSFAKDTATANTDIIKAIEEISNGADQQAVHSEQSAHIISVLDTELTDIWRQTESMQLKSKEAERFTLLGSESVEELNESAQKTAQMIEQAAQAMHALTVNSKEIGKIVNTITEISSQTNVLSLNAAIEAARAGIHGRGFAVIADEVRLLSQQTNESSKTIENMIHTIQGQMKEVDQQMKGAKEGFHLQNTKVDATLTSFHSIRTSMQDMILQMGDIHQKIDQAKTKNHLLVESIEFVATVAEQTAAGVEEVNSTSLQQDASIHRIAGEADDIHMLSQQLFAEINKFKADDIDFHIDEYEYSADVISRVNADASKPVNPPANPLIVIDSINEQHPLNEQKDMSKESESKTEKELASV